MYFFQNLKSLCVLRINRFWQVSLVRRLENESIKNAFNTIHYTIESQWVEIIFEGTLLELSDTEKSGHFKF